MLKKFIVFNIIISSFALFAKIDKKFIIFFTNTNHQNSHVFDFYSKVNNILKARLNILNISLEKSANNKKTKWIWLEQKSFHKYLSYAMQKKRFKKEKTSIARKKLLQVMEKIAIDDSIIVDCKEKFAYIKSCGIYYYSRPQKRILAATNRIFPVNVKNASSWARPMSLMFISGLDRIKQRKIDKLMRKISSDDKRGKKSQRRSYISAAGSIGNSNISNTAIPGFCVGYHYGSKYIKIMTDVSFFYSKGMEREYDTYKDYQVKLGLRLGSDIIKNVIWSLGAMLGYSYNEIYKDFVSSGYPNIIFTINPLLIIPMYGDHSVYLGYSHGWLAPISNHRVHSTSITRTISMGYSKRI
jgi:hypothetical protein